MDFYRGDGRGPNNEVLRTKGFTAKPPAVTMTGTQARHHLAGLYSTIVGKYNFGAKKGQDISADTNTIGQGLRKETPGNLIATAMTQAGAYQQTAYFYKITIPDNELTFQKIKQNGELAEIISAQEALTTKAYFLLFNNSSFENADILALCHGVVDSKEATFFTGIPAKYIVGYRSGQNVLKNNVPFVPFAGPHRTAVLS
ncbi:hypothetical protein [Acidiphilium sp.]|uniref:hypothetical protein n=1 Tax=Acidiphilium sp. TaxID=527 RepID=UPI0025875F8C|nr:hypothetical protein [Acidiphilium sp.]